MAIVPQDEQLSQFAASEQAVHCSREISKSDTWAFSRQATTSVFLRVLRPAKTLPGAQLPPCLRGKQGDAPREQSPALAGPAHASGHGEGGR